MTTIAKKEQRLPLSWIFLGLLALLSVGLAIYRLINGLGATTNLSNEYPWGLWITLDVFLIPIGGAAFTTSLISHFIEDERFHRIVRPAVLVGFLCYSMVGLILIMDLGRWDHFYSFLIPGRMNLHSFLFEVAICVTFYTIVLVLEIAPAILEKWNLDIPLAVLDRLMILIAGLGIVLSSMHQTSIGNMFLILSHKLHPLWWSRFIGFQFLIQAVFSGLAMAIVVVSITWKKLGIEPDRKLVQQISMLIRILLIGYLALTLVGWITEGDFGLLFTSGAFSLLLWIELIVGSIVPLAILFSRAGQNQNGVVLAGVLIILGAFLNRLSVSWVGLARPVTAGYTPHWIEVAIALGFMAGAVLVYSIVARFFRLFPEYH
ncbi:MAG: polysulfide reductase NrfD [Anaerolineales bacterium]|nr:polysulfide reductase NrfD [Anaerolineales bacterium]